jgi:hypothetical protein
MVTFDFAIPAVAGKWLLLLALARIGEDWPDKTVDF